MDTDELDGDTLAFGLERIESLLAGGTEQEVRESVRALVPEYYEVAARAPFADAEIPLVATGTRRAPAWPVDAPPAVAGPSLEPAMVPSVNVARAS